MVPSEWREKARAELLQAVAARQSGNEGKARVCARRAAGHIAGEYLHRSGFPDSNASAIVHLQRMATFEEIDHEAGEVAAHFLLRITPEHTLPAEVDLIAEARWLAQNLLGENIFGD